MIEPKICKYFKKSFLDDTYLSCNFDVNMKRSDNKYYNSYKIINNKIVFYSDLPINKNDIVKILDIHRVEDNVVVKLAKCDNVYDITDVLTIISYKPPLDRDLDVNITEPNGVDPLIMFIDSDQYNSKIAFLLCVDLTSSKSTFFLESQDFQLQFSLGE